jgi:L-alanine-DL-glutamate epimerase-like enolase superfamily enzyme
MVGSMMESELGLAAAAALSAVVAPQETHDLDAAWWSIDPADADSPYRDGRFVISPNPGLSRAVERVEGSIGPWRITTA